jgi:hypothetical protein
MSSISLASLLLSPITTVIAASPEIVVPQEVRALPGELDHIPYLHSNSPEVINSGGILLSTFPKSGKTSPRAHLDYALTGEFHVFAHHVTRRYSSRDKRSLYQGILLHNPPANPLKSKCCRQRAF